MGMDLRATQVLVRTGGKPYVKESEDSRTSDHPCFGPGSMVKIGQWRMVF